MPFFIEQADIVSVRRKRAVFAPELTHEVWPERSELAARWMQIPAAASPLHPNRSVCPRVDTLDVTLLSLGMRLKHRAIVQRKLHRLLDVANLRFNHVNDRTGAQTGIRSKHDKEIGKACHGRAGKRLPAVMPRIRKRKLVLARNPLGNWQVGGFKPRRHNQQVQIDAPAVPKNDARRLHSGDACRFQGNMLLRQRRIVVVGIRIRLQPIA